MIINTDDIVTLGDLAEVLRKLKDHGWGPMAVNYVVEQVWGTH